MYICMHICIYARARARVCVYNIWDAYTRITHSLSRFPRKKREESVDKSVIESRCESGISADLMAGRCLVFRFAQ